MGNSGNSKLCKPKIPFEELADDVDCSVTDLLRSVDNMISDTRMYMHYTDKKLSGDYDGSSESGNGQQLRHQCLESQKILNTHKQAALEDTQKLLHKFRRIANKKRYMGIEDNEDNLKLDTYMKESKPNLPVIRSTEDMDCEKLREKIRHYEEDLVRFKEQTKSLDKQLRASTEEIKQLKSTIQAKITENKDLLVKSASMENKLQSYRNEKQISQHVRVNAKDSEQHQKGRENVVQKERKQSQCRENENLKRENEDIRHGTGRLRAEFLRLEENTESRLEYVSLEKEEFDRLKREKQAMEREIKEITHEGKVKTTEIEKLKEDLKRLENNKNIEQELSCMRALNESPSQQEKESSLEIKQVRQEIASQKITIQSKVVENKDLLVKVDRLEKEVDSLTNKLQGMCDTRGNVQYIEQHAKNGEIVTSKSKEQTKGLEKEKKMLNVKTQDEHNGKCSISAELLKPKEDAEYCQTNVKLGKEKNKRLEKQIHLLEKEIKEIRLIVNIKNNEIRKLKDDIEVHVRDIHEQNEVCKIFESEKDALRRENKTIQRQLNDKDTEFGQRNSALENSLAKVHLDHKKEKEELVKHQEHKLNEALETNTKLKQKMLDLETRFERKRDENIELNLKVTELSHMEEKYRREQISQKDVDKNRNKRIECLEKSLEKASHENELMKEERLQNAETNRNEKEKLLKDIKSLKDENDSLKKKLKTISQKNSDLQTKLKVQAENNEGTIKELTRDIEALRERNLDTEKALVSVRHDKREIQQLYDTVKLELDHLKSTKTMHIQLYHHSRVSLVSKVEIELKALLKKEMEDEMFELDFVECGGEKEVDLNKPLLILCISASRLGTDASNAIQSLKLTPKMALLVFHHKDRHALPNQASEHVLTGQDFKRLGGIYDFGFLSSKGIYSCELNDLNIKSIVHFLHKEGTRCLREVSSRSQSA